MPNKRIEKVIFRVGNGSDYVARVEDNVRVSSMFEVQNWLRLLEAQFKRNYKKEPKYYYWRVLGGKNA